MSWNPIDWIKAAGHFFAAHFGTAGPVVQTILADTSRFINIAAPIVAELAGIAKAQPQQTGLISDVEKWLGTYQADAAKVGAWVTTAQALPIADILRTAATLALSALVPAGALQSDLNLAIEVAYSVFKRQTTSKTP